MFFSNSFNAADLLEQIIFLQSKVCSLLKQSTKLCEIFHLIELINSMKSELSKMKQEIYWLFETLKLKIKEFIELQATCNFQVFHDINEEYEKISRWLD